MVRRLCEVCRDPLETGDLLRGVNRREPLYCTYDTPSGRREAVLTRWVCRACEKQYGRRDTPAAAAVTVAAAPRRPNRKQQARQVRRRWMLGINVVLLATAGIGLALLAARRDSDPRVQPSEIVIRHKITREVLHAIRAETLVGADLHRVDLSKADLREQDLSRANLEEANLEQADLSAARLKGANLRSASLLGADARNAWLAGVKLEGADLFGADLQNADLSGAALRRANLSQARLQGANLNDAELGDARLKGAQYDRETRWPAGFDPRSRGAVPAK